MFPSLNQYQAEGNVPCSKTQHSASSEAQTSDPRSQVEHSTTEPLSSSQEK